jgi:hypothetical protein
MKLNRYEEAESQLLEGYEALRGALGEGSPGTRLALEALAELYEGWGKPEQAAEYQALLEEAQGVMAKD